MSERERTATAVTAMAAVIIAGCASVSSPRVPPGGISVAFERSRSSGRRHAVYLKDGERIDQDDLPEAMADNEKAMALARAADGAGRNTFVAYLVGWSFLVASPALAEAFRHDGRTLHEVVPLTTAAVGVAALVFTSVFLGASLSRRDHALREFNESRPPPPPPDPPPSSDGPICPIGAVC